MATKTKKRPLTPTVRAEARAQEEARAHARIRLTRVEVEHVLRSLPVDSAIVVRDMLGVAQRLSWEPGEADKYDHALVDLLRSLAEGLA